MIKIGESLPTLMVLTLVTATAIDTSVLVMLMRAVTCNSLSSMHLIDCVPAIDEVVARVSQTDPVKATNLSHVVGQIITGCLSLQARVTGVA